MCSCRCNPFSTKSREVPFSMKSCAARLGAVCECARCFYPRRMCGVPPRHSDLNAVLWGESMKSKKLRKQWRE